MTEFRPGDKVWVRAEVVCPGSEPIERVMVITNGYQCWVNIKDVMKRKPKAVQYAYLNELGIWETTEERYSTDEEFQMNWIVKKFKRLT